MVFSGGNFGELIREGWEEMTTPLDVRAVMRSTDADDVPGMGLARSLRVSRDNAVKNAAEENTPLTPPPLIERPRSAPGATKLGSNTWRRRARSPCEAASYGQGLHQQARRRASYEGSCATDCRLVRGRWLAGLRGSTAFILSLSGRPGLIRLATGSFE